MKTAKESAYELQEFGEKLKLPKFESSVDAMMWYEEQKQEERNEWARLVDIRDNEIRKEIMDAMVDETRAIMGGK